MRPTRECAVFYEGDALEQQPVCVWLLAVQSVVPLLLS